MSLQLEDEQIKQLIILAIVLIIVVPISVFVSYGIGAVEVISVISSSLLTLGLVVLYFRQQSTMEKQTKLMNREYISSLHFAPSALADGDELIFELKNTGRGKVRHIQMESRIDDNLSRRKSKLVRRRFQTTKMEISK
jgi:predicted ABC-type exoprotein transport system permease subunit